VVEPEIRVRLGNDGLPLGAGARARIERPVARVWSVIADVERYPGRVPMIDRVRRDGDRVTVDLKFKVAFVSVGFQFIATVAYEPERWLELRGVAGEPRGIRLRFDLEPLDGGACLLRSEGEFDVFSLGWLAKYFLRHHPEIQYGIYPGVALALLDSVRRAAESSNTTG
jgi:ribosome-associated toxin RatA of RatAB toxin-antitoxin module